MNKNEYLSTLDNALKAANVQDRAEVIEEYTEHFDLKLADGYSEEEIAAKLAPPDEIAKQFGEASSGGNDVSKRNETSVKAIKTTGVVILDIIVAPIYFTLWTLVFALGVTTLSFLLTGFFVAIGIQYFGNSGIVMIPYMPIFSRLIVSLAILSLAALSAVGTEYCRLYVMQIGRKYLRWHKNLLSSKGFLSPPLPLNPWISPIKRRVMRNISLYAIIVFAVSLVAGIGSMIFAARSIEPWHVWGWFV